MSLAEHDDGRKACGAVGVAAALRKWDGATQRVIVVALVADVVHNPLHRARDDEQEDIGTVALMQHHIVLFVGHQSSVLKEQLAEHRFRRQLFVGGVLIKHQSELKFRRYVLVLAQLVHLVFQEAEGVLALVKRRVKTHKKCQFPLLLLPSAVQEKVDTRVPPDRRAYRHIHKRALDEVPQNNIRAAAHGVARVAIAERVIDQVPLAGDGEGQVPGLDRVARGDWHCHVFQHHLHHSTYVRRASVYSQESGRYTYTDTHTQIDRAPASVA
jgi:hypothetical protein